MAGAALVTGAIVVLGGGNDGGTTGPCPDADGRSRELRECLGPSLAFVTNTYGSGSGVMIADGYLVTNLHVVEPFTTADITFTDGEQHDDVPVVGVDAFTDIAVVGPIETDRPALEITAQPFDEDEEEPDVFLIGFPGGVEDDEPAVTIAGGLLSRTRTDDALGLTYLQSDAAISGGQSGGALVDEAGRVLGISGLSFAEEFALALSAGDVRMSIDRILAGDGDAYDPIDAGPGDTDPIRIELTELSPSVLLVVPATDTRRGVGLSVTADEPVGVLVGSTGGSVYAVNEDLRRADEADGYFADADDLYADRPGHYGFELPGEEYAIVSLSRLDEDVEVTVDSDMPLVAHQQVVDAGPAGEGETRGILQSLGSTAIYDLELHAGDVVEIELSAGSSDPYFSLLAPGEAYDQYAEADVDDGGGGLYDLDSAERFEIDESGTWHIALSTWDGYTTGYVLTVTIS